MQFAITNHMVCHLHDAKVIGEQIDQLFPLSDHLCSLDCANIQAYNLKHNLSI